MRLSLHNELTGRREDLRPAEPPSCALSWDGPSGDDLEAFRWGRLRALLEAALAYLGWSVLSAASDRADLHGGLSRPASGLWLKPGGVAVGAPSVREVQAKGFAAQDLGLLCLKTHYRRRLEFSWEALAAARGERAALSAAARRLEAGRGALAPNAAGLAGYTKRFRDALADDLDSPEALATLWDALRPGALSPGSQLGALRDADRVLGLLRLG